MLLLSRLSGNPEIRKLIGLASVLAIVFGLCQLIISMVSVEGSYRLAALNKEKNNLMVEVEIIKQEVDMLRSIPAIHAEAVKLGMIPSGSVYFLDLDNKRITPAQ